MILVDSWGHLVSTESEVELHEFAEQKLHMKRGWYQEHNEHPHYDLTTRKMIDKAILCGAVLVKVEELARRAWWRK